MTDLEIRRLKNREHMRRKNGSFPPGMNCAICGIDMTGKKKGAKFCSNRCRQTNKYDKKRKRPLTQK